MKYISALVFTLSLVSMQAQENKEQALPYAQIPDYPESYTAGSVVSRMVDGLGFRFYWATEGLRASDLKYRPGEDSRSIDETLDHILGLTRVVLSSAKQEPYDRSQAPAYPVSFEEKRKETLKNLKEASLLFLNTENLEDHPIIFRNAQGDSQFPFWNQINGPIADALWHCGQVVSMRRQAGNPFPKGVSVLRGTRQKTE